MKIDYLELINEIASYKTGEEIEILRDVYEQLDEAGIERIKNDRSIIDRLVQGFKDWWTVMSSLVCRLII
ncbi:hypothetical protein [Enterococcus faecium]|uniref:hypothetical protein n=1 Tax=Enterococcus faecium TaxID=1352 RepID=UPI00391C0500